MNSLEITSAQTRANIETLARIERAARQGRTRPQRVVDAVTDFFGTIAFVNFHIAFFAVWLLLNVAMPQSMRFDPYPFGFLTLFVSLEAIFLTAFVLISQNRQNHFAASRNHLKLQLGLLSHQENAQMLHALYAISRALNISEEEMKVPGSDQPCEELLTNLLSQIEAAHLSD